MENDYEILYYFYQDNDLAYNLMLKKYHRFIFKTINTYKISFIFTNHDIEDLYSEAILCLYNTMLCYREDSSVPFLGYFTTCLKNQFNNIIKGYNCQKMKANRYASSLDDDKYNSNIIKEYELVSSKSYSINDQVYNNYLIDHFLLDTHVIFNDIQYKAIHLYIAGYSYKEIEAILDIKYKRIDNIIQRYHRFTKKEKAMLDNI